MPDFKAQEEKKGRVDYDRIAFFLRRPYSNDNYKGPIHIRDRDGHRQLIELARKKKLYVWTAGVKEINGKLYAVPPYLIDWDSMPEAENPKGQEKDTEPDVFYVCEICGKQCTSTSGYTLHMKKHE